MHLIAPLVSGVSSAANGTVRIVRRGTSTLATYYTDFEGTTSVTPTGALALDAYGGLVVYVNEMVDCKVYDSSGTLVRDFVAGAGAPGVEARTQSFTGVDYTSGASAASSPITLAAILDLWYTNAGAVDWKVLVNGSARSIQSAVASLAGLFFSVKDPTYGAVGNGVADDSSPVQAALTAAGNAGGGIVFFPAGSYLCGTQLTVPANVSLLGTGAASSKVYANGAAQALFFFSAAGGSWQNVSDLSLLNNQANSTGLLGSISAIKIAIERCVVGDAFSDGGALIFTTSASQYVRVKDCTVVSGDSSCVPLGVSLGELIVDGCVVTPNATQNTYLIYCGGKRASVYRCFFDNSGATSGTYSVLELDCSSGPIVVSDCEFSNGGGATVTAITSNRADRVYERGNSFGTSVTAYSLPGTGSGSTREGNELLSRDSRQILYSSDSNVSARCDQYGHILVTRGAGYASATTLTLSAPLFPGMRTSIVYRNSNAGGTTGTVTVTTVKGLASFTVSASSASLYTLESEEALGNLNWVLTGSTVNYTP